jgi:rubrerythrin
MNTQTETQTAKNLEAAFAGESMANRKYLYFAKLARRLGYEDVAAIFEDTAHHETGHAFAHLAMIFPEKEMTIEKLLQASIDGELYETQQMYPEFERIAREEGRLDAVAEFQEQGEESAEHARMFQRAAKQFHNLGKVEAEHAQRYIDTLDQVKQNQIH